MKLLTQNFGKAHLLKVSTSHGKSPYQIPNKLVVVLIVHFPSFCTHVRGLLSLMDQNAVFSLCYTIELAS